MNNVPNITMNIHANIDDDIPEFSANPVASVFPGSFVSFVVQVPGSRIAWFVNDNVGPLQELIANLQSAILEVENIIDGVHEDFKED